MATNKKMSFLLNNEKLDIALCAFVDSFKKNKKGFLEEGVNVEDVKSLTESFKGKAAITALSVAVAVITSLPIKEFLAFSSTFEKIQKAKLLEALIESMKSNGADNDIDK